MNHNPLGRVANTAALLKLYKRAFNAEFGPSLHTCFTNRRALWHCGGPRSTQQYLSEARRVVSA